jgi:hypothetical protein
VFDEDVVSAFVMMLLRVFWKQASFLLLISAISLIEFPLDLLPILLCQVLHHDIDGILGMKTCAIHCR